METERMTGPRFVKFELLSELTTFADPTTPQVRRRADGYVQVKFIGLNVQRIKELRAIPDGGVQIVYSNDDRSTTNYLVKGDFDVIVDRLNAQLITVGGKDDPYSVENIMKDFP